MAASRLLTGRLSPFLMKRCFSNTARMSTPIFSRPKSNNYKEYLDGKGVRIGCSSGFWGDTEVSVPQLLYKGNLDYLVMDYLSEITMSLLTGLVHKTKGEGGYVPDFLTTALGPYMEHLKKTGVKIISNGGGQNPTAAGNILHQAMFKASLDLNVAVITGDDLLPMAKQLRSEGITEMFSGAELPRVITSMNAYLGAGAIAQALNAGADIVVTGRIADSALVLGPLLHEFGWKMTDFDKLAMGSLAGHLVECGAQATGGIFTDWHKVPDWANIGFPIVECSDNGNFVLTKPPETGGLVNKATVSEQLVYEIGDPANYHLPDVVCDFTNVTMEEVKGEEGNAVFVQGAKGKPPSSKYKVCCTYADGHRVKGVATVGGPRAKEKAQRTMDEIITRVRGLMKEAHVEDFTKLQTEIIGSENDAVMFIGAQHREKEALKILSKEIAPAGIGRKENDAVMFIGAQHREKEALQTLSKEIAPAGTGMAPGLTGLIGGRPNVSMVMKLYSFLMDKSRFNVELFMNGEYLEAYTPPTVPTVEYTDNVESSDNQSESVQLKAGDKTYRLEDLAYTRSGDKGNHANIGVIARHPDLLPYIKAALTEEAVAKFFTEYFDGELGPGGKQVQRYDVPGIHGLNFMLYNSLGGGGVSSLRSDPQGKSYGQRLLDFKLTGLPDFDALIK